MMMDKNIAPVALAKASRLINHGPTILVSASHEGVENVMAAAWVCALDFDPPKLTVVLDKETKTRELIEKSGEFVIQVPTLAQLELTRKVGSVSMHDDVDKLKHANVKLFSFENYSLPFVEGCSAWMACKLIPEPHNQNKYDLFIGQVTAAWSDTRVFKDGHWNFENADTNLRSIHHVAGGNFYAIGEVFSGNG